MRRRKKPVFARWILSMLAGMLITTAIYSPSHIKTPVYAWWGTMYPQYCFSQDAEHTDESAPVKIDFRWLRIK